MRVPLEADAPAPAAESVQQTPASSAAASTVRRETNVRRPTLATRSSLRRKPADGGLIDEASAELAHHGVLLHAGRSDGDLPAHGAVRARDDGGLHPPQRWEVRHVP